MKKLSISKVATAGACVSLAGALALQQAAAQSLFVRDRNVSVAERDRPGYEAPGVPVGAYVLKPRLDLGVGYSSNVFALSDVDDEDAQSFEDEGDAFTFVRASAEAESIWSRHYVALGGYVEASQFFEFDDRSTVDAGVYSRGQLDIAETLALYAGLSFDKLNESRRNNTGSALFEEPVEYTQSEGVVGARWETGRLASRLRFSAVEYDFDDAQLIIAELPASSTDFDQDFRDRLRTAVLGEAAYALSPDLAAYVSIEANQVDFDRTVDGVTRDSAGIEVNAGVDFDLTDLLRGRIGAGYFEQDFDSERFADLSGASVNAALEWFPSQLTTVTLAASRGADESAVSTAGGFVRTEAVLRVDHELRRNVLLNAFVGVGEDTYEDNLVDFSGDPVLDENGQPIEQSFDRLAAGFGAEVFFTRYVSSALDYSYESQSVDVDVFSGGFDTDYDIHQVLWTVSLQR
ncbi:hypothetical protein PB2503_06392 [Parvularcula bermudensis HTCC2503]|uniref:Outer membrane beta-barrel protein n=1 Tax=Parvularcula bermudensis (strain ATCC BAA-594 / HTCC2503 / KCTC 12087) TaxID=314260 RepID=E0THP8_PARBH|nr:outer membrane beta-barrel protein [Parvularcula bermudensis]ADM09344.1 hypothetical protein PB2503_06392 [Parvularcula bermudensis HTCC2503]